LPSDPGGVSVTCSLPRTLTQSPPLLSAVSMPHSTKMTPKLLPILRSVLSHNQSAYLEYQFRAHRLHRAMRIASADNHTSVQTITDHLHTLDTFLDDGLQAAFAYNCHFMTTLFSVIDPYSPLPRICIKSNKRGGHVDLIFDLYRHYVARPISSQSGTYEMGPFPVSDNTGFNHVATSGTYFLEPDIPRAVVSTGYKNPRLDHEKVRAYKRPSLLKRIFAHRDEDWEQCWINYSKGMETLPPEACYKSTLIIPIGLSKSQLASEFLASIHQRSDQIEHIESLVFAYLCFDHTSAHYFSPSLHVDIGHMFAHILAPYFCTRWILTVTSTSYAMAHKRVRQSRHEDTENVT
jgi:hypothetical protein